MSNPKLTFSNPYYGVTGPTTLCTGHYCRTFEIHIRTSSKIE